MLPVRLRGPSIQIVISRSITIFKSFSLKFNRLFLCSFFCLSQSAAFVFVFTSGAMTSPRTVTPSSDKLSRLSSFFYLLLYNLEEAQKTAQDDCKMFYYLLVIK